MRQRLTMTMTMTLETLSRAERDHLKVVSIFLQTLTLLFLDSEDYDNIFRLGRVILEAVNESLTSGYPLLHTIIKPTLNYTNTATPYFPASC